MKRYIREYKYHVCKAMFSIGALKSFNFTLTKKHGNRTFRIPVINCAGFSNLATAYEPWFDKFLRAVLDVPDAVMIDVGVNIGQTIIKTASFKKDIRYLGFEPNPTCYAYSRRLILENKMDNYKLFPVGLAEKFQLVSLVGDNDYAGGASIVKNFRANTKRYTNVQVVAVVEGDKAIAEEKLEKIDFIKVDVEGAELEVMRGFRETIGKFKPPVMLEILPVYDENNENGRRRKDRQDKLLQCMKDYGYDMYLIVETNSTIKKIDDIPVHSDMNRTNYFFIPPGMEKRFEKLIVNES
jgi:FkbM family methyltransferase